MYDQQLILNRYRPISEAGSGGFATVQLAWDTRIQRRVAIKCIKLDQGDIVLGPDGLPVASATLPGLDEARTAALLSDSNIVGVYDFEIEGSFAYLIMEYVDGMTLSAFMDHYGESLSLDIVATVFSSVAHALEVAHDNQVLHLDIKPDNVLINRQGQVKVTDFGLATLSDAAGFRQAGGGTIGYMPPEQMRSDNLDARCDEWALASLTYEMITGTNPFFAPDLDRAEAAITDSELILPSLCMEGLDPEADDVLFYALDPDREERYDNVGDFTEELMPFLGNFARGHKQLAVLVGQACEDFGDEDEEKAEERVSVFDRLSLPSRVGFARVWGVLNVAILGFVALSNTPQVNGWTSPLFWGVFALLVLAAAIKPHLGSLLAVAGLSVALLVNQAYVAGAALLVAAVVWWLFAGRRGNAQANVALSPALFGSFGFSSITPLLSGFFLSVKDAVIASVFASALAIVLAGFGSETLMGWNVLTFWNFSTLDVQANIWVLLQQPMTWCIVASWIVASCVMSLFCLRQTRLFAFFGVVIAFSVLFGALCLGTWIASSQVAWMPDWRLLLPVVGAAIVMAVACALGVPSRDELDVD
ncbi:MAG: serine/threonine-protein kinase [Raoultibacter sp.]